RLSLQVQRYRTTQRSGCRDRHGLLYVRYGSYLRVDGWRWGPKAEIDYFGSPYRHAFNNPISFNDSDGDTPAHAVAAVIGAGINFQQLGQSSKKSRSVIGYAATGAIAGAATYHRVELSQLLNKSQPSAILLQMQLAENIPDNQ
ncbi:MAG: hypothetical protein IPJ13_23820, partial [Saprospiraceae bacterium]|nr:hypothetical protein [Saprospiraceae bacterium]